MKKTILVFTALAAFMNIYAAPRAFYIKKGDTYYKYNFGVTEGLFFSNEGKTLHVAGYDEVIDMNGVDHIYFDAPIDQTALTPASQKERLVKIGEEVNSLIDLKKVSDLLNMYHYFFDRIDGNRPPASYNLPEEYYNVHKSMKGLIKAASELANGNPAAIREMRAKAVDLYRVEDYFGLYVANRDTRTWVRTSIPDYLEIQYFSGSNIRYFVRLEASKNFHTWETKDFKGQLPALMTVTFGQGERIFATMEIASALEQDQRIDMDVKFRASDYYVNNILNIRNEEIRDIVDISIEDKKVISTLSVVDGINLLNYDSMYDAFKEASHYHDEYGHCCGEDPKELVAHFTKASVKADVLGQLQVYAKGQSFSKLYDILSEDTDDNDYLMEDKYEIYTYGRILSEKDGTVNCAQDNIDIFNNQIRALSNYVDMSFKYDNQSTTQGYLNFDLEEHSYNSYPGYFYYPNNKQTEAYTRLNGYLIRVNREYEEIWDDINNKYVTVYGDWYYKRGYYDQNGYYLQEKVVVEESELFWPDLIRNFYYDIIALVNFPDGSSFSFEDFFDEISFLQLIDDYNGIIDSYLSVTGQKRRSY